MEMDFSANSRFALSHFYDFIVDVDVDDDEDDEKPGQKGLNKRRQGYTQCRQQHNSTTALRQPVNCVFFFSFFVLLYVLPNGDFLFFPYSAAFTQSDSLVQKDDFSPNSGVF